jgi:uridine kinase
MMSRPSTAVTVLIDGPSGAGKTTLAQQLIHSWPLDRPVMVLHLDDVYPGWSGLDEASLRVATEFLPLRRAPHALRYSVWDWALGRYREKRTVPVEVDLIIEGCGALTARASELADLSIWIDADDVTRKERALGRGDEDFEAHWEDWDQQFRNFVSRENPQRCASLRIGLNR